MATRGAPLFASPSSIEATIDTCAQKLPIESRREARRAVAFSKAVRCVFVVVAVLLIATSPIACGGPAAEVAA